MTDKTVEQRVMEHKAKKAALIEEEAKMHFSYDLEASFSADERKAAAILQKYCDELANPDFNVAIRDFYANRKTVENSKLFEILNKMPKGAVHHIHTSAAPPVDVYLSLTYDPITYYNEREKIFKIFPKMTGVEDGYVSCVEMRNFMKDPKGFDTHLRNEILLTEAETKGRASHDIWKHFQHKFTRVTELGKYYKFFRTLLKATIDSCTKQNVFVVELRHISGMLFDEDRKPMGLLAELKIVDEVIKETQAKIPYFEMTLVITGLKIVGTPHINKMIDHIQIGKNAYPGLISGFDMVNEEDYTEQIESFMPEILSAQLDKGSSTFDMPTFCHAGETHDMNVTNLHDAMLLNTKRIGHGFQLFLFPNLVDECIKKDVCVEVCPLSNMVLGYTFDLRTHPIRDLTHKGLQFSISSDDPGFFDYEGVTLDYAYATLAWELNLRDLKKLSLNGITYSSISQEKRDNLREKVFPPKWNEFIKYLLKL